MVPYMLAWDLRMEGYFYFVAWASTTFWTLDLLLRFGIAFADDDEVVRDLRRIVQRYLRGFFLFDLTVVVFDWLNIMFELTADDSSEGSHMEPRFYLSAWQQSGKSGDFRNCL